MTEEKNIPSEVGFSIDYSNYQVSSVKAVSDSFERIINRHGKFYLYDEMMKNEPLIGAFNNLIESSVVSEEFLLKPADDSEEALFYKDFVESVLKDMEEPFSVYLKDWLTCVAYGFQLSEMVLKKRLGNNPNNPKKHSKHNDGLIGVRKFSSRHQKTIEDWKYDNYRRLTAVTQSDPNKIGKKVDIPYSKLLHFKVKSYNGNPVGESMFRPAALPYYNKKNLIRMQNIEAERGSGIFIFRVPPEWSDKSNPKFAPLRKWAEDTAKNLKNSSDSGVVIPSIPCMQMQGKWALDVEILSGDSTSKQSYDAMIDRCDTYIGTSLLSQFLLTGKTASITGGLSEVLIGSFKQFILGLVNTIRDELNTKFLSYLWEMNGFPIEKMPQFHHTGLVKFSLRDLSLLLQSSAKTGLISPTYDTEVAIRRIFGSGSLPDPTREEWESAQRMRETNTVNNLDIETVDDFDEEMGLNKNK